MTTAEAIKEQTQEYLEAWARDLGIEEYNHTLMATVLLRQQMARTDTQDVVRNFDTAISILFGAISWVDHRDWLRRAVTAFTAWAAQPMDWESDEMPTCLYNWAVYYDAEVEKAPT